MTAISHRGPGLAANENIVCQEPKQEGNVRLMRQDQYSEERSVSLQTLTPRIRNSTSARSIFLRATSYVVPLTDTLTRRLS